MLTWLSQNIGTIIVLLVVVLIVAAIVKSMRRDKKNGKSSCGGNCAACRGGCMHAQKELPIHLIPPERRAQLGNRLCPFCVL